MVGGSNPPGPALKQRVGDKMHEEKIAQIVSLMEMMLEDSSIPKNIKRAVESAKKNLQGDEDPVVKAGGAIYNIEEVSEDINLPQHARTQIWQILSALENIKDEPDEEEYEEQEEDQQNEPENEKE